METVKATTLQIAAGLTFGSLGLIWLWRKLALRRGRAALRDKVVLITGASSGIGEAFAHGFYRAGSKVILCARRAAELERVKKELESLKLTTPTHPPSVLPLDLEDIDGIPKKAEASLALHGRVDILINNGGISSRGSVLEMDMAVHQKIMRVNHFGTIALTKALLPSMIANRSGHVVTVSSVQGKIALPYRAAYGATKHAVNAFCDSLRAEVSQYNIYVTVLSPSYIRTNISYNSVKSNGTKHGELDPNIATGMSTDYAVKHFMNAIIKKQPDLVLGPFHHGMAIYLRLLSPRLYNWIMAMRARGSNE